MRIDYSRCYFSFVSLEEHESRNRVFEKREYFKLRFVSCENDEEHIRRYLLHSHCHKLQHLSSIWRANIPEINSKNYQNCARNYDSNKSKLLKGTSMDVPNFSFLAQFEGEIREEQPIFKVRKGKNHYLPF